MIRYLWADKWGRLALITLAVGIVGLISHQWFGFALVAGLQLPRGAAAIRAVTPERHDHRMAPTVDLRVTSCSRRATP